MNRLLKTFRRALLKASSRVLVRVRVRALEGHFHERSHEGGSCNEGPAATAE